MALRLTIEDLVYYMRDIRDRIADPSKRDEDQTEAVLYGQLRMLEEISHREMRNVSAQDRDMIRAAMLHNNPVIKDAKENLKSS